MRFDSLAVVGAFLIHDEAHADSRGSFARIYCEREVAAVAPGMTMVQSSLSHSRAAGTLRGMHFQWPPAAEDKLVRCTRGCIFDVLLDLRPHSATFLQHVGVELSSGSGKSVLIPKGLAHGFVTLQDDCEILYMMSAYHSAENAAGVRWNDPAFAIRWPVEPRQMSDRDASYADFDAEAYRREYSRRGSGGP